MKLFSRWVESYYRKSLGIFLHLIFVTYLFTPAALNAGVLTMPSSSLNVSLGGSVTLSASAEGLADSTVSWSIVSGGGSIDAATGVYTAPEVMPVGGLAVVCATSNADPTRSGCVTIRLSPALALGGLGEPIDLPGVSEGVIVADMNGDGRPDLVAGDNFSRKLSVVLNAGEGAWEAAKTYEVGEAPYPSVGDFTGDGWADVVMTGGDGSLHLLANTADFTGTLTPSPAIMTLPADVRNLKPVHVDTDGTLDLVALAGNSASMMLRGTEGDFEGPAWLFYGSISGAGIADFDGDGRPDIVASGLNEGKTYILPGP